MYSFTETATLYLIYAKLLSNNSGKLYKKSFLLPMNEKKNVKQHIHKKSEFRQYNIQFHDEKFVKNVLPKRIMLNLARSEKGPLFSVLLFFEACTSDLVILNQ